LLMNWKAYRTKLSSRSKRKKIIQQGNKLENLKSADRQMDANTIPDTELVH